MPKPKRLSGADIVRVFKQFGFVVKSQSGSHIKLARQSPAGEEVLIVSNHKELKTGAVVGIFRQATQYLSESELRPHFYNE